MRRLRTACAKHRREIKFGKIESEVKIIPYDYTLLLFLFKFQGPARTHICE